MRRLNERAALMRTVKQLGIKDPSAIRLAYGLVVETERRKNLIDKLINEVFAPKKIGDFNLGIQAFLRLYVYQTRVIKNFEKINLKEAENIASLARAILGWQTLREVEPFLGFLLTKKLSSIMEKTSEIEKISLETFHPMWFVEYCIKLFGQEQALTFLNGSMKTPPTYIRVNTLKTTEEKTIQKLAYEGVVLQKTESLEYTYRVL
ncbi:MAG: hypothetical protein ACM3UL_00435, partial [Ignavibacteria bacterium]